MQLYIKKSFHKNIIQINCEAGISACKLTPRVARLMINLLPFLLCNTPVSPFKGPDFINMISPTLKKQSGKARPKSHQESS